MKPAKKHFWDRFKREKEEKEVPNKFMYIPPAIGSTYDAVLQHDYPNSGSHSPSVTNPIMNFNGTANSSNSGRVTPPDPTGDVGPNHYVQTVNSMLQIFSKSGTSLYGPVATSTIWNGFSGPWSGHNDGDAIVLYDEQADRWLISQFAIDCGTTTPYGEYELVAISTTSDPTGSYYRYAFQFDYMPDYPKIGVWQDGYYMAVNRFNTNTTSNFVGVGACVLDRTKMLVGNAAATMQYFKTETLGGSGSAAGGYCYSMLPSDCDGSWAPAGAPNYFTYISNNSSGPSNELRIWALHADFITPASSTFTFVTNLPVSAYTMLGSIVPQQGTTNKLDGLGDRLMFRNQYRNFSTYETFLTCHNVSVNSVSGIRWYEYRKTGTTWSVFQQSTYAPSDGKWRWLGSIAMNSSGDIGLAYTASSSSMYPSIYFTGRRAADPISTMAQPEGIIQTGTASITGASRWGDYSAMSVDPTDNTTFWTTHEYVGTYGGTWPWATKIASFKWSNQPSVTTTTASAITGTSGTLNGTINPNGLSSNYHFEWGTTVSYGNVTPTNSAGSGSTTQNVNAAISGLISGTIYHYRLVAVNSDGTSNGNDMTFIPGGAVLTTSPATAITMISATSGGNISADGGSSITARGVCWSTTANPTITGSHTTDGSGLGVFTSNMTGLTANTLYHIMAYATNPTGTWYGNDLTFNTLCGVYTLPFSESFSGTTIPNCWSQVDHVGNGQIWQFGTFTGGNPNPNLTGNYAYLNSDGYGSGGSQNADLISPVLDCSAFNNVTLQFSHSFKSYSGSSGTLSYTINGGSTWTTLATFTTTSANPATYNQVITAVAGQAQVQFRWNYTGAYAWYWAFNNMQVTGTSSNTLSVTPPNQNVPASPAGSTSFTVTSNTSWNASSNQSWCTVTPSGTGNGTITANYTVNTLLGNRVATITVTATGAPTATVTVTQAGMTPTLSVVPTNQNVPASPAGSTPFTVTSNTSWTAVSDSAWCTVTPSGSGNGTINAAYLVNPYTITRVAHITVTVAGLTPVVVTVTQAASPPSLTVTPPNQNVPASPAGSTSFNVTSNTSWNASSNQSWCTVTPSGSGNGTITANYSVNTLVGNRVATITVTATGAPTATVTVTQAGILPTLSVVPTNQNVPASPSGSTSFTVTSNTSWTAVSDSAWCTVTPSGTGNGTINAAYLVNPYTIARVAHITVTVTGLTPVVVTVTQAATPLSLVVTPPNQNVPATPAGSTAFNVSSNTSWSASSNQSWCTVTPSGTGNGTITANYSVNALVGNRVATITVTATGVPTVTVTVTQDAALPTLSVVPASQNVPASPAGSTSFTVTSNTSWTAVSDSAWCTVTPSGSGNGTITASYTVNPYTITRVSHITVTVAGLTPVVVTVTQAASPPSLTVTPPNQNVPATPAGSTVFTVTANLGWTATSNSSWCTVTPSGSGNGTITASYSENTMVVSRIATISVSAPGLTPVTVTVTQDAGLPTLIVNPLNQNVPATPAGQTVFNVTSNTDWTVSSDQSWCTVTQTGSGNQPITATYSENTSTNSRITNITVTVSGLPPVVVTVTQGGTNPTLTVTPANQNVAYFAGNTTFTVLSNSAWTASSDSAWLTVSPSGTGNGSIDATFLENPYYTARIATITVIVAGIPAQMVTVNQAQSTVSVQEHGNGSFRIIPNPAKGTFRIDVGDLKFKSLNVTITDVNGKIILYKLCWEKQDMKFDLSGTPDGVYIVKVSGEEVDVNQKLILKH